jgi:hypothetical protein
MSRKLRKKPSPGVEILRIAEEPEPSKQAAVATPEPAPQQRRPKRLVPDIPAITPADYF